jgi:hypothetical protein
MRKLLLASGNRRKQRTSLIARTLIKRGLFTIRFRIRLFVATVL